VENGNFENRGELLLADKDQDRELKWDFARDTLVNVHRFWKRPVHLRARKEGKNVRLSFDGKDHKAIQL
jgi:stage V sporulation protein R